MAKLLKAFEAPHSFVFIDPDTGRKFHASSRQQLVTDIIRYRVQNQLEPILHLNAVVENYWCSLPENVGKCQTSQKLERDFYSYLQGGVALFKAWLFDKFTTQEVADERAKTCLACPHNVFPDKDGFVAWSDDIASRSVGERKAKDHNEIGNCGLCGCLLKSKVWFGGEIVVDNPELYPDYCWQIQKRKP